MWAVENNTDFDAERAFVRDRDGSEIWIVAVRATFDIRAAGELRRAAQQDPVVRAPRFQADPSTSSLLYDSDLVRTKAGTDVIVHGTAYAPNENPVGTVETSLELGSIRKRLRVHGDRVWERTALGLGPSAPAAFVKRAITYEMAQGGPLAEGDPAVRDPMNPAGIGRIAKAGDPVPAIESPDAPVRAPDGTGLAAGYGPIAGHWQSRVKLAGTYDDAWRKSRQPLLPEDFQDDFYRCAPADQQVSGFLHGGEEVVLRNLTAGGLLQFKLPRVSLGFRTRIDGGITNHRGQLHTVIIEPDALRLIMVWQTALPCHHTLYSLKETVVFEKQRNPLGGQSESQPIAVGEI
jgi:hypothetical protein